MADLSDLLGDVYGESAPKAAPAWADESRLDEAFADWEPEPRDPMLGEDDDDVVASSSEPWPVTWPDDEATPVAQDVVATPVVSGQLLDDDLAAALSAALAEAPRPEPVVVADPVPAAPLHLPYADEDEDPVLDLETLEPFVEPIDVEDEPVAEARPWRREDDDIVPARGKGGRLSFRLR